MFFISMAHAQEAAASAVAQPSFLEQMFLPFFILVVFYIFILRPQSARQKKHQDFLSKIKRGDSVLTSGGIFGTIEGINEQFVILEVAEGVKIRVLKTQLSSTLNEEKGK